MPSTRSEARGLGGYGSMDLLLELLLKLLVELLLVLLLLLLLLYGFIT